MSDRSKLAFTFTLVWNMFTCNMCALCTRCPEVDLVVSLQACMSTVPMGSGAALRVCVDGLLPRYGLVWDSCKRNVSKEPMFSVHAKNACLPGLYGSHAAGHAQ